MTRERITRGAEDHTDGPGPFPRSRPTTERELASKLIQLSEESGRLSVDVQQGLDADQLQHRLARLSTTVLQAFAWGDPSLFSESGSDEPHG